MSDFWIKNPDRNKEFDESSIQLKDENGFYDVFIKWDGCVDFTEYDAADGNGNPIKDDKYTYIHICDLDRFIDRLLALRKFGHKHFNNEQWPDE